MTSIPQPPDIRPRPAPPAATGTPQQVQQQIPPLIPSQTPPQKTLQISPQVPPQVPARQLPPQQLPPQQLSQQQLSQQQLQQQQQLHQQQLHQHQLRQQQLHQQQFHQQQPHQQQFHRHQLPGQQYPEQEVFHPPRRPPQQPTQQTSSQTIPQIPPQPPQCDIEPQPPRSPGPDPMRMHNGLPDTPVGLFQYFVPESIVENWAKWTNGFVLSLIEKGSADGTLGPAARLRKWFTLTTSEIYIWLAIVIYMRTHTDSPIISHWMTPAKGELRPLHPILKFMTYDRYTMLSRYIRIIDPADERVEEPAEDSDKSPAAPPPTSDWARHIPVATTELSERGTEAGMDISADIDEPVDGPKRRNMKVKSTTPSKPNPEAQWATLLDKVLVNSFVLQREGKPKWKSHGTQLKWKSVLCNDLISCFHATSHSRRRFRAGDDTTPLSQHKHICRGKKSACLACQGHKAGVVRTKSHFPASMRSNGVRKRPKTSRWGCDTCDVSLCKDGSCWDFYHSLLPP